MGTSKIAEALAPAGRLLEKLAGPLAEEIGGALGDSARVWRLNRALKLVAKAERLIQDAGYTPTSIPPRLLLPILDGASLEDDDDMQAMWANLLANAADERKQAAIPPSFPQTLRQLSPTEAIYLSRLFTGRGGNSGWDDLDLMRTMIGPSSSCEDPSSFSQRERDLRFAISDLLRLGILEKADVRLGYVAAGLPQLTQVIRFTIFGLHFMKSCAAPEPVD